MNSVHDRIVSLVGQGYAQAAVAAAVGVTPAYVSQVLDEPAVREQVTILRTKKLTERVEDDETLESLERRALKLVADKLPYVRSPMEATKIYQTLNSAKRKTAQNTPDSDSADSNSITITLPRVATNITIQLNQQNQVVDVNGRSMATLPSRNLPELARLHDQPIKEVQDVTAIQGDTRKRLMNDDATRADKILKDMTILIDGVPCVL